MSHFVTTVVFTIRADQYKEAKGLLSSLEKIIPMQPGCIYFQLLFPLDARLPLLEAPQEQASANDAHQPSTNLLLASEQKISFFKRDVWEDSDSYYRHAYSDVISSRIGDVFRLALRLPQAMQWERISDGSTVSSSNNHWTEDIGDDSDSNGSELEEAYHHDDGTVVTVSYRMCEPNLNADFSIQLRTLAITCREKQLAITYDIHASLDPAEPHLFMEYSIWQSKESYEAHFNDPDVTWALNDLLLLGNGVPKIEVFRKFTFCD
eukprot:CAMPEP_0172419678 /NCGR_PEP_ID=MMETSP1064-20121228/6073_1 /TAXON_ID=202472 /ORGANISM="Aulacoseira subarctica , Strain CCAP 1002/5" /LENGTH=263 /DNA_ID=CAMNT_0013159257 /DNA_START=35 /DNA_END=829 /DNA_ORIENTATION=-